MKVPSSEYRSTSRAPPRSDLYRHAPAARADIVSAMRTLTSVLGNSQRLDGGAMFGNAPKAMWEKWIPPDALHRHRARQAGRPSFHSRPRRISA